MLYEVCKNAGEKVATLSPGVKVWKSFEKFDVNHGNKVAIAIFNFLQKE